jgi:GTP-binding protein
MQHFVDSAVITVRSGKGGAGCVSFLRQKYNPNGGPNGGDGGTGGNVVFHVKNNLRTLYHLKLQRHWFAENGQPGKSRQKFGKKGKNIIVEVPPGTIVYDNQTNDILADLREDGTEHILLKGGKGGMGNMNFATSTNQAPRYAQPGIPGQELEIRVELKLIADIGLLGFPNAGKSTLLSVITNARPKIASYPFTTISPNLGVFLVEHESFVIADIPGIIEGAAEGAGLGIEFLKHIERTKILLYMIDLESEDYLEQYDKLTHEISSYASSLGEKPSLIAATKTDLEESAERLEKLKNHLNKPVIPLSSILREGLQQLKYSLKDAIVTYDEKHTIS